MEALTQYRTLRKDGQLAQAAAGLRLAIPHMEPNAVAQAGKLLQKDLPQLDLPVKPLEILLLGQCTTNYLPPVLTAWTWAQGLRINVTEGEYDQVVQTLMRLTTAPDAIIVLPWNQRVLGGGDRSQIDRIADEMEFLQQAWAQVARLKSKLIQISYDWTGPGALGYTLGGRGAGEIRLIQQLNQAVKAGLPAGAGWIDLEALSAWHGKAHFYDPRNYHWLKQPFSPMGLSAVSQHMAASLRALNSGRRKVLVLDLDNTVWGGVVGEVGPCGIAISGTPEGEAFAAFQQHAKCLRATGVILAACSKNNEADAREPFARNDQMVLKLDDFASFHASWDPKPARIRRIAEELNLGLDSFVFFDDNPAERAHVQAELPEVLVVDVPQEPALYIRALVESLAFEAINLTSADAARAEQYSAETSRKSAQTMATTPEQYLSSLEMVAVMEPIDETNLDRVVDLITKTNQFNLTTRRHSRSAVEAMVASDRSLCFSVKLKDKFGDYGLVSVVLAVAEASGALEIDTWLMSCRAMGRTLEYFVFNHLCEQAVNFGYQKIIGSYISTQKSVPVANFYEDIGFTLIKNKSVKQYAMSLTNAVKAATQIRYQL